MHRDIRQSGLVQDMARGLVGVFAPEELDLFDELAVAPTSDTKRRNRDDPLAFGFDVVVAFTPVAIELAATAVTFLAGALSDAVVGAGKDEIKARIRNWLGGKSASAPPVEVTISTASALVELVKREGERLGLGTDRSAAVADALLVSLRLRA